MKTSELRKKRETTILSYLNKLGVVNVEIIKRLNIDGLGNTSDRNVLRVMQGLEKKGLIKAIRKECKIWILKEKRFSHIEHRLMMNLFIARNGLIKKAIIEPNIKMNNESFRPDFMVLIGDDKNNPNHYKYYEVDRMQKMKVNRDKVARYKRLGLKFEVICPMERSYQWKDYVYHVL